MYFPVEGSGRGTTSSTISLFAGEIRFTLGGCMARPPPDLGEESLGGDPGAAIALCKENERLPFFGILPIEADMTLSCSGDGPGDRRGDGDCKRT